MSAGKERPILFSGPMVRALLSGAKTQTRRVVKVRGGLDYIGPSGDENNPENWGYFFDGPDHNGYMVLARGLHQRHNHGLISIPCPYGQPGDRLWVRERWMPPPGHLELATPRELRRDTPVRYGADGAVRGDSGRFVDAAGRFAFGRGRPSIHMPRWASRLTLEIAGVRVERLHAISEEDARAEGVEDLDHGWRNYLVERESEGLARAFGSARESFFSLWEFINGAESWVSNPWVWVVEFRRVA